MISDEKIKELYEVFRKLEPEQRKSILKMAELFVEANAGSKVCEPDGRNLDRE